MRSDIPASIVSRLLRPLGAVGVRSVAMGMSGGRVFRVGLPEGRAAAIKCWPPGIQPPRVEQVRELMRHCRAAGVDTVPEPLGQVVVADRQCWDAAGWMPGEPLAADAAIEQICRGARHLAQFHAALAQLGQWQQTPPAVTARLERLQELQRRLPTLSPPVGEIELRQDPRGELLANIESAWRLLRWKWDEVRPQMTRSLTKYVGCKVPTQWVLRDVHREHLLFVAGQPTGLIDFDAIRVDTPMADLSRWVGSFLAERPDSEAVWHAALADYKDEQSFFGRPVIGGGQTELEAALAKDLFVATTWISLANWVLWIVAERRQFAAGSEAVAGRVDHLRRLAQETLCTGTGESH